MDLFAVTFPNPKYYSKSMIYFIFSFASKKKTESNDTDLSGKKANEERKTIESVILSSPFVFVLFGMEKKLYVILSNNI